MKVLLVDIETTPIVADVWALWDQNVGLNQIHKPTRMLSFVAKWKDTETERFKPEFWPSKNKSTHKKMIKRLHALLNDADVVVHFYGKKFDIPHANREFVELGLTPPSPYHQVDLKQEVSRNFKLPSNKLQYVATWLGFEGKVQHSGHSLWTRCIAGDPEAWTTMEEYNIQDVLLLEDVFNRLAPWIKGIPNAALFVDDDNTLGVCPSCTANNLRKEGTTAVGQSTYQRYQCRDCGKWSRGNRALRRVQLR